MERKLIKILLERIDILEEKIDMLLCKGCTPHSADGGVFYNCPVHGKERFIFYKLEKRKQKLKELIDE
jgi:hypothetical protein